MFTLATDFVAFSLVAIILYGIRRRRAKIHLPFPPGPNGLPLLGNIYQIPSRDEWVWYRDLSRQYGSDVVGLNFAGTSVIVVNTMEAAAELFDKRYSLYNDRPRFLMVIEMLGLTWDFGFKRYGEEWRVASNEFHKEVQPAKISTYHKPCILDATRSLLHDFLENPSSDNGFLGHSRHMLTKTILSSVYGMTIQPKDDPYVALAQRVNCALAEVGNPGAFLVESVPLLRYLPGAGYKSWAAKWRNYVDTMPSATMDFVRKAMADGTAVSSVASRNLQQMEEDGTWSPEKEKRLESNLAVMYSAGADTTTAALGTFMLAMAMYPEVQRKAQTVVDATVGTDRLPDFTHEKKIPYIEAVIKEVLRWKPVLPLSLAHYISTDDVYNGYHIPANSIVIGNAWAMLHDPAVYGVDTDAFRPERFMKASEDALDPDVPHPDMAFGFGRRICPGRHLAQTSLWLPIVSILACFHIEKAKDEPELKGEYTSGMSCYPMPFKCVAKPRTSQIETLIRDEIPSQ